MSLSGAPRPPDGSGRERSGPASDGGSGGSTRIGLADGRAVETAPLGRRAAALAVDWAACVLVSIAFFRYSALATLGIFALEQIVLVGSIGASLGHRLLGIVIVSDRDGRGPGLLRAIVRTVLLCLVVPALVWLDARPLHDRLAGTVVARARRR